MHCPSQCRRALHSHLCCRDVRFTTTCLVQSCPEEMGHRDSEEVTRQDLAWGILTPGFSVASKPSDGADCLSAGAGASPFPRAHALAVQEKGLAAECSSASIHC